MQKQIRLVQQRNQMIRCDRKEQRVCHREQNLPEQLCDVLNMVNQAKFSSSFFTNANKFYHIKHLRLDTISQENLIKSFQYIRAQKKLIDYKCNSSRVWFDHELKIYIWLVIAYVLINKKCISLLKDEQWQIFLEIFHEKNPLILKYQALILIKSKGRLRNKSWSEEEEEVLRFVMEDQNFLEINGPNMNWKQLGIQLFERSNQKYIRSPKQIRQHWINHLDPTKSKQPWNIKEDLLLLQCIEQYGKKWSHIAKILTNRTQHRVKNRYFALIKKNKGKSNDQEKIRKQLIEKYKSQLPITEETFLKISQVPKFKVQSQKEHEKQIQNQNSLIHSLNSIDEFSGNIKIQEFCAEKAWVPNQFHVSNSQMNCLWHEEPERFLGQE